MKKEVDIVILGAGASGLMLGALLKNKDFLIIDNNPKIGSKILVSGGGRCNITNGNVKPKNFVGEQGFVRNVIKRFDQHALLAWLAERGLQPIVRKNHQYFCESSAKELVYVFQKAISSRNIQLNTNVENIKQVANGFEVYTSKGKVKAKKVVVATGGLSFPKLGATDIGYEIAKSFGHEVTTLSAGLVGFTVQPEEFFFKSLSGVATDVKIKVGEKEINGSLLFTHKGISGPAVLDASLYWSKGKIEIDFMPNLNISVLKTSKKNVSRVLGLASRVAKTFLDKLNIEDKTCTKISSDEWKKIESFKSYTFAPAGTFGYSKAEVTKGGVVLDEIDASSMMSQKVDGLYFLGEVLDVTGELGGYNFQWAFSSAYVCAKGLA
ncbi:MAG TPA: aminoacetone oxidase family FAD-binding enzyme [Campylobacterales bacterium]|nr:aminoacetone oxidase family FAD-binding enzyme [Flavobacteriaceae bacterium]HIP51960.1 aminoacetone oxidase family FAD-binding enzyme [Campylobacterales bacterium]